MEGTLPNQEVATTAGALPDPFADAIPGTMMQKIIQISAWCLRWSSIEFLDDFRVACRRSRSILSQLKSALPEAVIKPFLEDFAWLSRLTSAVRDLDVFLLKLRSEELKKRFVEISLQPLVGWLEGRRDEEQNLLGSHLQSERFQKFSQSWNAFLHGQSSIDLNTEETSQI